MNPSKLLSRDVFSLCWPEGRRESPSLRVGATWATTYEQILGFQLSTPSIPPNNAVAGIRAKVQVANVDFLARFYILPGGNINVTVVILAPPDFSVGITGVIHGGSQGKQPRQVDGALEDRYSTTANQAHEKTRKHIQASQAKLIFDLPFSPQVHPYL
jgi:hypothetical protein